MDISQFVEKQADDQPGLKEVTPEEPKPEPEKAPEQPATAGFQVTPRPETAQPDVNTEEITNNILNSIGDLGSADRLKFMVFGDPGSTKSSFASTAEKCLILDLEKGLMAAKFAPHGIGRGTKSIPYTSWKDFIQLVSMLKDGHPDLDPFETFAIDSFSDLHKRGLQTITERDYKRSPSTYNQFKADVDQQTENNEKLLRVLRVLRDIDRNLIIISHARTVEPKNKPAKTYGDFSESLSNRIMGMMDAVGYTEMREIDKKETPVMRLINNGKVQSKNRFNLPSEVIDPTFPQILNLWEKAKQE